VYLASGLTAPTLDLFYKPDTLIATHSKPMEPLNVGQRRFLCQGASESAVNSGRPARPIHAFDLHSEIPFAVTEHNTHTHKYQAQKIKFFFREKMKIFSRSLSG
jgi:hypothetical protein